MSRKNRQVTSVPGEEHLAKQEIKKKLKGKREKQHTKSPKQT